MMCCPNCPRYLRISRTCMYTFKSNLILVSLILLMCTHAISNSNAAVLDKTLVYCFDASPTGFDANQARSIPEYTTHPSPLYNRLVDFRRGVKFHTTPWFKPTREFNAEDVLFTFERMRNPNMPFRKAYPVEFISFHH